MYSYSDNLSFASPRIEQPINTVETKVWARGSSTYYTFNLAVGYVTNVDQVASSAVWVDTITLNTNWAEYTISFAGLTTTDTGYVVYRKLSGGYGTMYIDDIIIREVSSCAVPQGLHTTGTAALTTLVISFELFVLAGVSTTPPDHE